MTRPHLDISILRSFSCGRKSETAVANARIFEIMLRATGMGAAGYAKPNTAQTAKTKNMPARRNRVALDSFMTGENVSIAKLEISTRKSGKKKSRVNSAPGSGGYVHHITMRSKGSAPASSLPLALRLGDNGAAHRLQRDQPILQEEGLDAIGDAGSRRVSGPLQQNVLQVLGTEGLSVVMGRDNPVGYRSIQAATGEK
jgi:hypothetical protein